ncbi:MAG: Unknown protein [uncultured Sulfurovum sp.]|uniref:Uncharacterized protein n=1 Tax=uncultured Sulfurovum sp. TaxID=269237 RepID=A0A6S6T5R5_9BACT|nr:MAG: Unknown protein [uncultured Sulfurovum sp.]
MRKLDVEYLKSKVLYFSKKYGTKENLVIFLLATNMVYLMGIQKRVTYLQINSTHTKYKLNDIIEQIDSVDVKVDSIEIDVSAIKWQVNA